MKRVRRKVVSISMNTVLLFGLIWQSVPVARSADESTARFYDELRQRALFGLVESDCLRRLELKSLGERERSELVLELSRTFAAHAWQTTGAEQSELLNRARTIIRDRLGDSESPPRRELLETQLALIDLAESEWIVAQFELNPDDNGFRQRGNELASLALERFTALEKRLVPASRIGPSDAKMGSRSEPNKADGALTAFERRALWQQVRWRLGVARLVRAKLSEAGSADRAALLVAAEEGLLPLANGPNHDRLTADALLSLVEAIRLRGDLDRATKLLETFEKSVTSETLEEQRERFVIERVRCHLAKSQPTEAAALLLEQRRGSLDKEKSATNSISWSGELAYWQIVTELAMWHRAAESNAPKLADEVWTRATAEVAELEQSGANYWAARARAEWQIAREVHEYGPKLAMLVRQAKRSFAAGEPDRAVELFDEAISQAKQPMNANTSSTKLILELSDLRAVLLFQAKRYAVAAQAFRELAEAPRHDRSAAVHFLWASSLGRLFEQSPSETRRAEFVETLRSLRERYADQPEAHEAAWLLGQLAERDQKLESAIELYRSISSGQARYAAAWAAIARCHERLIARLRSEQKPCDNAIATAVEQLVPAAKQVLDRPRQFTSRVDRRETSDDFRLDDEPSIRDANKHVNSSEAELLVRTARMLIENPQPKAADLVERSLIRVIESARTPNWVNVAKQLQIVVLAGKRKLDEAEQMLESLDHSEPDELLALLDGLSNVATQIDGTTRRFVAELQLRASRELAQSPQSLTDAQRARLGNARAEAFAATGQPTNALSEYQRLLEKSPRNLKLLQSAAELSETIDTPEAYQKAKGFWRRLETLHKPGSLEWFDARWHVIRNCQKLGEQTEADKLLKVTRILYPDLGNKTMKRHYEELSQPTKPAPELSR